MAEKKSSEEISMPVVDTHSTTTSTKSLVFNEKKKYSSDLWWKITITIAVMIIAGYIIYKAVDDSKESSVKISLPVNEQKIKSEKEMDNIKEDCPSKSIVGSQATFTYQPFNSAKPYKTLGLEFSFKDIKRKLGVESDLKEFPGVHYYYNIARCRIGGGLQLDKEPIIRGPIVFAVDEQCTKAYYFSKESEWKEYSSARNINCSAHGKETINVDESVCLKGSLDNSKSSFVYLPFESMKPSQASGAEFPFELIAKKTKLGSKLTKLNKLMASTSNVHYYYNIPRCKIGGGLQLHKEPVIRGPLIFAVDEQCDNVYYFTEGKGWSKYISARNLTCSRHGNECFKDSIDRSFLTFQFFSGNLANVTAIQYNFSKLVGKLENLKSDLNLTKIPEMQGVSYYLNLHRCYNGGPPDLQATPQIRGAIIFAVNQDCSRVFFLNTPSYQWKPYNSARNIKCINRQK